ncbi:hypothetical protein [Burkholderia vietnamiensis]|uniref:hypothetical protein n=1 Tax=Burkholderia vietnamiensis TaxID=60552 RepID=UPI001CF1D884|nr:hypothetical protein [Burkholderia vietnamiensis]MCA8228310.1 hypothetical protein [Burkholderia vietnamiensis]
MSTRMAFKFKKVSEGRFQILHPDTRAVLGFVVGRSNNWAAEALDGHVANQGFPTRQDAAHAIRAQMNI